MKKHHLVMLGLGCVILVAALLMRGNGGIPDTTKDFRDALLAGEYDTAYALTAPIFQKRIDRTNFRAYLEEKQIENIVRAEFQPLEVRNNIAQASGQFISDANGLVPVKLSMVRFDGKWRVAAISTVFDGGDDADTFLAIPTAREASEIITDTTVTFFRHMIDGNYAKFYNNALSKELRAEVALPDFISAFQSFGQNKNFDPETLRQISPVFTVSPGMSAERVLYLDGYFPVSGQKIDFDFEYVKRGGDWKIVAIRYNID